MNMNSSRILSRFVGGCALVSCLAQFNSAAADTTDKALLIGDDLKDYESSVPEAGFFTSDGRLGHPYLGNVSRLPLASKRESADGSLKYDVNGLNWGGYVSYDPQGKLNFTSATGFFTIPNNIICNTEKDLFAPWVGLNGWGNETVQQAGVVVSCASGVPTYQAWYEMYPAGPVYYNTGQYPVGAGDLVEVSVANSSTSPGSYSILIQNVSKGWAVSTRQSGPATAVSAEVVTEAPDPYYNYPNFGAVAFTRLSGDASPGASNAVFKNFSNSPTLIAVDADWWGVVQVKPTAMSWLTVNQNASFSDDYLHE